jgi:hypothetical protein
MASLLLALVLIAQSSDVAPPVVTPATVENPVAQAPETMSADEARSVLRRGVAWMLEHQNADGSWATEGQDTLQTSFFAVETHYAFQMAASAIACKALAAVEATPERVAALEKGVRWLCANRVPKRGNDWDVDNSWTAVCGFDACVALARDPRFAAGEWKEMLAKRGAEFYTLLEKNQEPAGGWGYYEGPVVSQRPTWSTSFTTAYVVPALVDAKQLGWKVDPTVLARAVAYVRNCALPNGAYEYDYNPVPRINGGEGINDVKGSLGRIQVCNWARSRAGDGRVDAAKIRAGLELFFENHKFLDVARLKPIPHEAYYANAAYFYFFGHHFAAQAINELPADERERMHARLRPHLAKVQFKDGSSFDFIGNGWALVAGTSFSVLALQAGVVQ